MNLKVTKTFKKTAVPFYNPLFRQIVSMGGSRSSKSYSILQLLMLELVSKKNLKITAWRDTKVTCRATLLEDFEKIITFDNKLYKKFIANKQNGSFLYKPTNSRIIFEGADNIGKVLGSSQDISFFNEVTEFSKQVYLQITQRTSGKVLCDYNPSKSFWLETYKFDERTKFIHSDFRDNAYCPENIVEQLLSYEPYEPYSYEVIDGSLYYKGKPITPENQPPPNFKNIKKGTADLYMWLVYGLGIGAEKPNKIYRGWKVVSNEEFDALPYESFFGMDFGAKNPTTVVEAKYDGDGTFYVKGVFYQPLTNISGSLPSALKKFVPQIKLGESLIVCDSAKELYITTLREAGYNAVKALKGNNTVSPGITQVQSVNMFYVEDENFSNELDTYSWKVDRYGKATDEPEKKDDHYMDAVRYIITYLIKYFNVEL